jgi:hypothetical protein
MNGMKALLAPMVKTGQRVAKLSQRQQIFLSHKTSKKIKFVEDKTEHRVKVNPTRQRASPPVLSKMSMPLNPMRQKSSLNLSGL